MMELREAICEYLKEKFDVAYRPEEDIFRLGVEGINRIWRNAKLRAVGLKREKILVNKTEHSVGSHETPEATRVELQFC